MSLFKTSIVLVSLLFVCIEAHLRDKAKQKYIGTALAAHALSDPEYNQMAGAEFNSASPENEMKWAALETSRGHYNFGDADKLVAYAQQHDMKMRGHTFLWHRRIPAYAEALHGNKAELEKVVKEHITKVATHFKGKIYAWDVVNEVLNEDGSGNKLRKGLFLDTLGPSYVEEAFRTAHAADPNAKLYINDYGIEGKNKKSDALYELVKEWKAKGVPIHGVGVQAHFREGGVASTLHENLKRFADLGLDVAITELNIRYKLPGSADKKAKQAQDYEKAFSACKTIPRCVGVTVWGFTDKYSNIFDKGYGEQELWDQHYKPKSAVNAVEKELI
ncbi:endo-1,4-beta-xylanase A-like [Oppia nitens]|uniref:endo-1,4-beta-xylanase A-like n=1 Tax=Oppia nitens TaxID=1686743 RepID=UPI0023DC2A4C|nr:endo-1,4-beta-xylanase A-like [Oppia nitens]